MNVEDELAKVKPGKETWFSVGVFDGVHLGHQQLLTNLRDKAKKDGCLTGVLTFKSHPDTVIRSANQPWINDLDTRIALIKQSGIDIVVVLDFTREVRQLDARNFLGLLKKYLRIRGLVMGPDFALGRDRSGSIGALRTLGQEMNFAVEVMQEFMLQDEIVSSSAIRKLIMGGDVKKAALFLGRPFSLSSQPVPGAQRGRTMGFPTINIQPEPEMVSPANGVYATITNIAEGSFKSVTNVGVNPTFGGRKRVVETYLMDYSQQSEIDRVEIAFIERLRNEVRFKDSRELIDQMKKDVEVARSILKNNK
jgi:riboflavin kinase / FMN adenylyltransferase